jgi:hypothetical protein
MRVLGAAAAVAAIATPADSFDLDVLFAVRFVSGAKD